MVERTTGNWRDFQEKVAELFRGISGCRVFVDYPVKGSRIRNVKVDVLAEFSAQENPYGVRGHGFVFKVIVECKYWKTKIPQERIFALKTIVEDTGAAMGLLVTEVGVQSGAEEYLASPGNLRAITFEELHALLRRCPGCGKNIVFVFDPKDSRPVLCRDCYAKHRRIPKRH